LLHGCCLAWHCERLLWPCCLTCDWLTGDWLTCEGLTCDGLGWDCEQTCDERCG
jgi:hypothetical protein